MKDLGRQNNYLEEIKNFHHILIKNGGHESFFIGAKNIFFALASAPSTTFPFGALNEIVLLT